MRLRRRVAGGALCLAAVLVLLGLGSWQVRRLAWKEALLARIAAAERAAPVALPAAGPVAPYTKVRVVGRFRAGAWALWRVEQRDTPAGPLLGAQLLAPLIRTDGAPVQIVRGWVPLDPAAASPVPLASAATAPAGEVAIVGYVRPADRWGPFAVVALGSARPGEYPAPARHLPRPRNEHLWYAITWFGLAGMLAVSYLASVFCNARGSHRFDPRTTSEVSQTRNGSSHDDIRGSRARVRSQIRP